MAARRPLRIGLVNNMPDAALAATEAQFRALLEAAAGRRRVALLGFSLEGVPRGELGASYVHARYGPAAALAGARLDALVVTGANPVAARVEHEPFWTGLVGVMDAAVAARLPTVFSCFACHAAALHLYGVERRRLEAKCTGVFEAVAQPHPLAASLPERMRVPHSRWNALDAAALAAAGLRAVSHSAQAGADAFTGGPDDRFLFLQGHPEYAPDALMLEFRRDVRRYLTGGSAQAPQRPTGYFPPALDAELAALGKRAAREPSSALLDRYEALLRPGRIETTWRADGVRLVGAWLDRVVDAAAERQAA